MTVTPDELAAQLRTNVTAANQENLQLCIDAATQEAEAKGVDSADPVYVAQSLDSALGHQTVLMRAVEWFKANDAAFGVIGVDSVGALRAPTDGFGRHADALLPLRERFGLA